MPRSQEKGWTGHRQPLGSVQEVRKDTAGNPEGKAESLLRELPQASVGQCRP